MSKIAMVGEKDSIMGFAAVGIDTFFATDESVSRIIHKLAREKYSVIFVTESVWNFATEAINRYKTQAYPAIISIPGIHGSTGLGLKNIKANVEKAVGVDIFSQQD